MAFVENSVTYSCLLISAFVSLRQDMRNRGVGEEKQVHQEMIQRDYWIGDSISFGSPPHSRVPPKN